GVRDRGGNLVVRQPERRLQPVRFEAERRLERKRPGPIAIRGGGFADEVLDRLDGHARRDLAGHVAAHAVGDHEETEVGPAAIAVFVAGAAESRIRADGPGQAHGSTRLRPAAAASAGGPRGRRTARGTTRTAVSGSSSARCGRARNRAPLWAATAAPPRACALLPRA